MRSIIPTLILIGVASPLWASVTITSFTSSLNSPQSIGTSITFTANASDTGAGPLAFQFSVSFNGGPYTTVQDFRGYPLSAGAASDTFVWGAALTEGSYSIQLTAEDFGSGQTAMQTANYRLNPLVSGSSLVLSATNNPLVVLASGPSCPSGSSFAVSYWISNPSAASTTPPAPCDGVHSMNQYVTGLYADYTYKMNYSVLTDSSSVSGPANVSITTGALPRASISFPPRSIVVPAGAGADPSIKNVLWGHLGQAQLTRHLYR